MKHLLSLIGGAVLFLVLAQGGPALAFDTTTSIFCTDPTIPFTARSIAAKEGYPDPGNCYAYPMAGGADYKAFGSTPASLVTGRSAAAGQIGIYCATPAKTCELYHASFVGGGCSCRVPGGRSRGYVSP
ncbi:MAG: hypothetical protein ACREC9_06825 [Methylocella sp.]